jgi:hypothetical protein
MTCTHGSLWRDRAGQRVDEEEQPRLDREYLSGAVAGGRPSMPSMRSSAACGTAP